MAYFDRKPEKPGSLPGAASGGREKKAASRVRGAVARVARAQAAGRPSRAVRSAR